MKTIWFVFVLSVLTALEIQAQLPQAADSSYTAAHRTAHQTLWQRVTWRTNMLGRSVARTNCFVELATGLNFFDEVTQQWQPSREEWQAYPDAIVAQGGGHRVVLAHNLNLGGSVDVLLARVDGLPPVRLISNPVGLGFFDPVDGKQLLVAEVKDCAPQRGAASNEIVFRDCFHGIRGSIRYLYTRAGFHQHVVLEQRLQLPEGFSDKTRLEFYTEFAPNTPLPQIKSRVLRREKDPRLRAQMMEPDFTDSELAFSSNMKMRAGTAFSIGEGPGRSIRVGKRFEIIGGRPVLTESVEFKQLEPLLARLAEVDRPRTGLFAVNSSRQIKRAGKQAGLPLEHFRGLENKIQLTSSPLKEPAVVIDYELLSSEDFFTLRGDTTYFVDDVVNLVSPTVEGGVVVKVSTNGAAQINFFDGVDCRTGAYRPAIFTVQSDNSVGETLPGSTGVPAPTSGGLVLHVPDEAGSFVLEDVRFSYLDQAVSLFRNYAGGSGDVSIIRHAQFSACAVPFHVENAPVSLQNVLASSCARFIEGALGIETTEIETYIRGEHVTVRDCGTLTYQDFGASYLALTNSLFVGVTNWGNFGSITTNHVVNLPNASGVFQTVGAGSHYLVNNSTNRGAGTTNINSNLLAALKTKTTYPPTVLSNITISVSTNLLPQAPRDTNNAPDLGYHYDVLDYLVDTCIVTNATVSLSNGAAIAYDNAPTGFWLQNGSTMISVGTLLSPNWLVHYTFAQEQPVLLGGSLGSGGIGINSYHDGSPAPDGQYRFTRFVAPVGGYIFYHSLDFAYDNLSLQDCELWNGVNELDGTAGSVATVRNNLFHCSSISAYSSATTILTLSNNLILGTSATFVNLASSNLWRFHDNAFDSCTVSSAFASLTNSHNAYINSTGRLNPTNANDVVLSSFTYASGPLGDYYQSSTNLLNAGSVNDASLVGLYHYTTTTNQVKETNSIVDIGFHYVAVDGNGQPIDTDCDGLPDYLEDKNGDGAYQNGDLANWQSTDSDGDGVSDANEIAQGRNPNGAGTASDTQNLINRRTFKPIY